VAVSGLGVAEAAAGFVLLLSGVRNTTLQETLTALLRGQVPTAQPTGAPTVAVASDGAASSSSSASSSGAAAAKAATPATSASAAANQALARSLAVATGHPTWATGQQWADWVDLWNQESGWRTNALNPSSGATGIPQLNPGSHAIPAGWTSATVQILWGINYIAQTYGSPSAAWAHEESEGWY
jgi:hypothetical protein